MLGVTRSPLKVMSSVTGSGEAFLALEQTLGPLCVATASQAALGGSLYQAGLGGRAIDLAANFHIGSSFERLRLPTEMAKLGTLKQLGMSFQFKCIGNVDYWTHDGQGVLQRHSFQRKPHLEIR